MLNNYNYIENWFKQFEYYHGHGVGIPFEYRKSINLQHLKNKDGKINLEENFGDIMTTDYKLDSGDYIAFDTMLDLVNNSPEEMDFCFDTIDKNNEQVKRVFLKFRQMYSERKFNKFNEQYFLYLGSYIVPFYEKGNFDTLCKILNKRIDFLLSGRYGYQKIEIDQKQKDKLIIQTLMYGSGSLYICGSYNEKQIYKTISMLTGEEKFVNGYKFSLDDIKNIISCTEKARSVHCVDVLKFCVKNLNGDVKLYEVVNLMHGMGIKIKDAEHELCTSKTVQICLPNKRYQRLNGALPITKESEVFDNENYLKAHIKELPKDDKQFDKWFLFFEETHPYFYQTSLNQADKKVKNFFIQVINCIPDNYLSLEKFNSLMDYFVKRHKEYVNVAKIDLTVKEFISLKSKMDQQMDNWDSKKANDKIKSCITISDKEISEDGIQATTKFITKKNELERKLAELKKDLEEVSDNDGIFAKAWNRVCNAFFKFVYNMQLRALEKKMEKAYKEVPEKNDLQELNDKISKEENSLLDSISTIESASTPGMQPGSKEQKK